MLGNEAGFLGQVDLLEHGPLVQRHQRRIRRAVMPDDAVNLVGGEGRAFVFDVPRLAADLALGFALGQRRRGRLDDVAGGGLGGVGGILLEPGDLGFECRVLHFQFGDPRHQRRDRFGDELLDFRVIERAFHPACCTNLSRLAQIASANIGVNAYLFSKYRPVDANELCSGERILNDPVGVDEWTMDDMLNAIGERYLMASTCPCFTSSDGNEDRINWLLNKVKEANAQGVIYYVTRGCMLYAMEYTRIKKAVSDKINIPMYYLDTEFTREDVGQMKTRVEAFLEMLTARVDT